jgi:hypothetical protein
MIFISYNAFVLGAMVFLAISFGNFIYAWLCKIWKIKIIEFALFLNPWFSLFKKDIDGTKFIVGWLPLGSHLKPLGMLKEDLENIPKEELPFSFLSKSRSRQIFFHLTPFLVWLVVLLLSFFTLKSSGTMQEAIVEMSNYILIVFKTLFGAISTSEFVKSTTEVLNGKNIISFALILMISMFIALTPVTKLMPLLFRKEKEPNWLVKILSFAVTIFVMYLALWKIPAFVFSFFSFRQNMIYIFSFFLGLYFTGALAVALTTVLVKLNAFRL